MEIKCLVEGCSELLDIQEPVVGPVRCKKHEGAFHDPELCFQRYQFDGALNSQRFFLEQEGDDTSDEVTDGN